MLSDWITDNYIEIFGAITGILYVFLEIRQTIWLWPVGIVTSAVYIWVFFTGKLYADMSLQGYYLVISVMGWYWWTEKRNGRGGEKGRGRKGEGEMERRVELRVTRVGLKMSVVLAGAFLLLFLLLSFFLARFTDSPVPGWDSFITSLSIIATWMLARKIYEHWFLWIIVNTTASILFFTRGLYPTVVLYVVYCIMSFAGLHSWRKTIQD